MSRSENLAKIMYALQQRLKWLAHLEFAMKNSNSPRPAPGSRGRGLKTQDDTKIESKETLNPKGPLAWDSMVEGITRTNKLR